MDDPLVLEWMRYAEEDYRVALHLSEHMRPIPVDIVCYHGQQSAEKYFKAYLLHTDKPVRKTHDIQAFCRDCSIFDSAFDSLMDASAWLAQMATLTRYPDSDSDLTDADMQRCLKSAQTVRETVIRMLG